MTIEQMRDRIVSEMREDPDMMPTIVVGVSMVLVNIVALFWVIQPLPTL